MTFKYYSFILGIALLSCKEDLKPQETSKAVRAEQNASSTTTNVAQTTNSTISSNNQNQATGPLNPAHGQPGHRCDIAVGAPLTSSTNNSVQTQNNISTQNIQVTPQSTTSAAKTAKGINPPHGQPGHRCDIAVGEPLNSKPKTTTNTTSPTTNYSTTPAQNNTPALLSTNNNETKPGMNPPHGQPGHVCGIPVGSPLNEVKTEEKSE